MADNERFEEREVDLATGKVSLLDGGSGSPVVFLHHSWGSAGWLPVHEQLARDFRVIVPDMPGFGASVRPAWAREPRDLAILTGQVIDALELDGVTLVGAGFGGFVAAELATLNPSRLSALVLIGAAGLQPEDGEIKDQMLLAHRQYMEESFRDRDAYVAVFGDEPAQELRDLWDLSREMTARVTWKPYMFNRRLGPLLGNVVLPTLVLWGGEDKVVPVSVASQFERAIANAHIEIIAAAGHLVEFEEPESTASLIAKHAKNSS